MTEDIKFAVDELDYLMAKVARVHGDNHPELVKIKDLYDKMRPLILDGKDYKNLISEASALSNGFSLPADACQAYTRVYKAFTILNK